MLCAFVTYSLLSTGIPETRLCVLIFITDHNFISLNAISEKGCLFMMSSIVCLTGCETWTSEEGVASLGATLYTSLSLSECLKLCLEMPACVAVDYSVVVCGVHTNINDTAATFSAPGFTRYTLNRACQTSALTLASLTSSTAGIATSMLSTYFGE